MLLAHGEVVHRSSFLHGACKVTSEPGRLRSRRIHWPEALNVVSPCGQFQRLIESRIDTGVAATGAQTSQSDPYRETTHNRRWDCTVPLWPWAASRQRPRWTWVSACQASIYSRKLSKSCSIA